MNRCSWVSCSPLFLCQLVGPSGSYHHYPMGGGFSLPTTPKTVTPLSFPGQVGDAGFRKTGAVDSGRTLGGDPKGLG